MDTGDDIRTQRGLIIPEGALRWTFARSAGSGGQHVNKTATKVTLALFAADITGPSAAVNRAQALLPEEIRITSQTSRSQWRNRQICIEKLCDAIDTAAQPPAPPRRKSRPSRGAVERRLSQKKRDSEKKEQRRKGDW